VRALLLLDTMLTILGGCAYSEIVCRGELDQCYAGPKRGPRVGPGAGRAGESDDATLRAGVVTISSMLVHEAMASGVRSCEAEQARAIGFM
jgi:hypothetical protein